VEIGRNRRKTEKHDQNLYNNLIDAARLPPRTDVNKIITMNIIRNWGTGYDGSLNPMEFISRTEKWNRA